MLNAVMLNVIMLNAIMLNVVMLNVVMLNVVMLDVIMLDVIMLNVVMLNVIMQSVVAPIDFLSRNILALQQQILNVVSIPGTGDAYNFEWHFKKRFHHKKILWSVKQKFLGKENLIFFTKNLARLVVVQLFYGDDLIGDAIS